MQLVRATLFINGDRNFAVPKTDISVAEGVLLKALHGQDSLVEISPTRKTTTSLRQERDALMAHYGDTKEKAALIDNLFQNVHLQGLETLEDLLPPEPKERTRKSAAKGVAGTDLDPGDGGKGAGEGDGEKPKE